MVIANNNTVNSLQNLFKKRASFVMLAFHNSCKLYAVFYGRELTLPGAILNIACYTKKHSARVTFTIFHIEK